MSNPPFLGMTNTPGAQPITPTTSNVPAGPSMMPPAYLSSRMGVGGFQMGGQNMADAPTTPPPGNSRDWVWGNGQWRYAPGQGQMPTGGMGPTMGTR